MRNTQATLYRIGKIINFVFLGLYALWVVLALVFMILGIVNFNGEAEDIAKLSSLVSSFVVALIYLALVIVFVLLCGKFVKQTEEDKLNFGPVIVLLVFGVLTWNYLFTAGSIVGIVAISKEKNAGEKAE